MRSEVVLACLLLAACSESNEPSTPEGGTGGRAGASASGSGSGAGQAGRAGDDGTATGGGGASDSCMRREREASTAVANAIEDADLSCASRDDCENISIDTLCHAACGALVSVDGKRLVEAVIDAQNERICATFEEDGCMRVIPPCIPPGDYDCVGGRCEWLDGPPRQDAGGGNAGAGGDPESDAGPAAGEEGCIDRALSWGSDGGRVAYQQVQTLTPCNTFSIERRPSGDPTADATCENEVAANAGVTVDDIDAALAHADVQAALADAPVLYGSDPRAFDGAVLRIQVGSAVIEVGGECNGASGCTAIPPGVAALRTTLQALTDQQRALPDCDELP